MKKESFHRQMVHQLYHFIKTHLKGSPMLNVTLGCQSSVYQRQKNEIVTSFVTRPDHKL